MALHPISTLPLSFAVEPLFKRARLDSSQPPRTPPSNKTLTHTPESSRLSEADMHTAMTSAFKPFKQYIECLTTGKLDGYLDSVHRKDKFVVPGVTMSTDPQLLLHDLGKFTDQGRIECLFCSGTTCVISNHTCRIISNCSSHSQMFETSGAGKTRLLLEGLCHHWGFYIPWTTEDRGAVCGSKDLETAVKMLPSMRIWNANTSDKGIQKNQDAAKRVFAMLLCGRVFILDQFIRTLPVQTDVLEARRRWVLLQAMPARNSISDCDIFEVLIGSLCNADTDTMLAFIRTTIFYLDSLRPDLFPLPAWSTRTPYFAVIDEAQEAADHYQEYFRSSTGTDLRPTLHELHGFFYSLRWIEGVILSGTGLSAQIAESSMRGTSARDTGRPTDIRLFTDTGHFLPHEPFHKNYVLRYLSLSNDNISDVRLLERILYWFSGRYVVVQD